MKLRWPVVVALVVIAVVTTLHYTTHGGVFGLEIHTLLRRIYYLPIAVLAVVYGLRGGVAAGALVAAVYAPHALLPETFMPGHLHGDPSPLVEKLSEMLTYLALGTLVGAMVDRSRRAERQLSKAHAELERTTRLRALGRMVAGVAHEVKNPLAAMHTTAELLLDSMPQGDKRHRIAELQLQETERLERVVSRFLNHAKPQRQSFENVELKALLQRVEGLTQSTARTKNVELSFSGQGAVSLDAEQAVQVLLNIVLNAVEASPDGATVRVRGAVDGDGCIFTVDDEGAGVQSEANLFEPFYTTRDDGSGLGLSEARQLALAHGGGVEYQRRPHGSRFTVRLRAGPP